MVTMISGIVDQGEEDEGGGHWDRRKPLVLLLMGGEMNSMMSCEPSACMWACQCFSSYLNERWFPLEGGGLKKGKINFAKKSTVISTFLKMLLFWKCWWYNWRKVGFIVLGYSLLLRGLEGIKSTPRPYCAVYDYYLLCLISRTRNEQKTLARLYNATILGWGAWKVFVRKGIRIRIRIHKKAIAG